MAGNKLLRKAKSEKKDEFYTQLADIEKEMRHYKAYFKGKVILCNCDDPYESNFVKYFALNFNALGLKKLIATCYSTSPIVYTQLNLFDNEEIICTRKEGKKPYKIEICEVTDENQDGRVDLADMEYLLRNRKNALTLLEGDGDFRSAECIELLKQADIVVTNPPFSLFREYIAQLMEYKKDFIIIGNLNAITYKEVFPLIAQNKLWLGVSIHSGDREFRVPDDYPLKAAGYRVDENGIKYIRVKGVRWFTNIDTTKRHENLILYKTYNPAEYPKYDNYDAINVDKTADIPNDYDGVMGVPITFLDKYNPAQFEIVAFRKGDDGKDLVYSFSDCSQIVNVERERERERERGRTITPYFRILIRKLPKPNVRKK
ncbi:MAG: adenine-specific methyltransferase EcoRI family protein [Oscillospiraceae bacterium]|nr:adenine-specific methyltransferase EcoRI family protein [Oscillospiraceae bacterium]